MLTPSELVEGLSSQTHIQFPFQLLQHACLDRERVRETLCIMSIFYCYLAEENTLGQVLNLI